MKKPTYTGWIDRLPNIKINLRALTREYRENVEPIMQDVIDQNNQVLVQKRYHLTDTTNMPATAETISLLKESFDFTHITYRLVMPNTAYNWHWDPGEVCYHIPLETNTGCWFVYEHRSFQMPADGSVYIVNNGRMHTFVNAGSEPRLHLTFMDFGATNQNTY